MAYPRTGPWTPAVHRPLAQAAPETHHLKRRASGSYLTDAQDRRFRCANNMADSIFQAATGRIGSAGRQRIPSRHTRGRLRRAYKDTRVAARSMTLYVPIVERSAWLLLLLLAALG